jgi:hypothetical protein
MPSLAPRFHVRAQSQLNTRLSRASDTVKQPVISVFQAEHTQAFQGLSQPIWLDSLTYSSVICARSHCLTEQSRCHFVRFSEPRCRKSTLPAASATASVRYLLASSTRSSRSSPVQARQTGFDGPSPTEAGAGGSAGGASVGALADVRAGGSGGFRASTASLGPRWHSDAARRSAACPAPSRGGSGVGGITASRRNPCRSPSDGASPSPPCRSSGTGRASRACRGPGTAPD